MTRIDHRVALAVIGMNFHHASAAGAGATNVEFLGVERHGSQLWPAIVRTTTVENVDERVGREPDSAAGLTVFNVSMVELPDSQRLVTARARSVPFVLGPHDPVLARFQRLSKNKGIAELAKKVLPTVDRRNRGSTRFTAQRPMRRTHGFNPLFHTTR